MEQMGENASCSSEPLVFLPVTPIIQLQYPMVWEDNSSSANYTCRLCMKTFYNRKALQNHRNLQHDDEATGSDEEQRPKPVLQTDQNNGLCGFKFIPLQNNNDDQVTGRDGLITRTFTKDCTYLIIKIEGDDIESDAVKRSRLDGVGKRPQSKPKPPIDLRGPFTCTFPSTLRPDLQCRRIFFNCCDYSVHYREEHTKRRKAALRCQVCEKRLDRDFYPTDSIAAQLHAANQFTFSCRICSQTFLDSTEYDEHNRIVHAKTKPHECSICAKRFTQQGGLQQHMRMHTGVRPFVCTFCPKAFTQKAGLDQHLRIHTKEKPFKCVICSKCFSQSVHLRQHMRTHTNIQPFECSVCGRKFKQSSHLNFHMRSHLGDSSMVVENYAQGDRHDNQLEFLKIANLQPVQDGETIYYAAELAAGPTSNQNSFSFQPQVVIPENVLSL
ncbi:zinc finger protein Xfin-like isoform X1 [Trichoplusia ni]|uniref:Zinc finger protein Xfin-like isoform X1 n=1 Tax=Trichoplusia ni TaxID=7111 RepID=A0A7E5VQD2_TRINI|nr:zinc finger protein Xfin-like isoform X1 [Trichoplusia ni]